VLHQRISRKGAQTLTPRPRSSGGRGDLHRWLLGPFRQRHEAELHECRRMVQRWRRMRNALVQPSSSPHGQWGSAWTPWGTHRNDAPVWSTQGATDLASLLPDPYYEPVTPQPSHRVSQRRLVRRRTPVVFTSGCLHAMMRCYTNGMGCAGCDHHPALPTLLRRLHGRRPTALQAEPGQRAACQRLVLPAHTPATAAGHGAVHGVAVRHARGGPAGDYTTVPPGGAGPRGRVGRRRGAGYTAAGHAGGAAFTALCRWGTTAPHEEEETLRRGLSESVVQIQPVC
jgi:hypothetical protein